MGVGCLGYRCVRHETVFCTFTCRYQTDSIDLYASLGYISTEFEQKRNADHASVKYVIAREKAASLVNNRCLHNMCVWGGSFSKELSFRGCTGQRYEA